MRTRPLTVLVFPGGTEIGTEIWRALRHCKEVRLVSAAADVPNHAPFLFRHHVVVPPVSEPAWLAAINRLIRDHGVDYVFPANDIVIDALTVARDRLACPVVLPPSDVVRLTRSKRATLQALASAVPVPRLYGPTEAVDRFPVFARPDAGYGGQGARRLDDAAALTRAREEDPGLVITEVLSGPEYTVDCFSARDGLLFAGARERGRVRMGTSLRMVDAPPDRQALLADHAARIQAALPLRGAWNFQMKEDASGIPRLLEVSPRLAGSSVYNRARGVNFPLLSLHDLEGHPVSVAPLKVAAIADRRLDTRFALDLAYDTVYVDLDDTLVIHGQVNCTLVAFLFQCRNAGKRLVLISKSLAPDPDAYLASLALAGLFHQVHWLAESDSKARYVLDRPAIFIDDSFSERRHVAAATGVPTLDPAMVDLLIDERS